MEYCLAKYQAPEGKVTTRWLSVYSAPAGLLLCHDLPLQTDREGRGSGHVINVSLRYQQMLSSLIREVCDPHLLPGALRS